MAAKILKEGFTFDDVLIRPGASKMEPAEASLKTFAMVVIGGMGSIPGALLAAIMLGVTRSFGSLGFPLFVDGVMFIMMVAILVFRPQGLLGEKALR